MEKVITSVLLTIAAVTAAVMVTVVVIPQVSAGSGAVAVAGARLQERMKTDIAIIHAAGEPSGQEIRLWVKNTGSTTIEAPQRLDVFLTSSAQHRYLSHGLGPERWQYELKGAATWSPGVTAEITIVLSEPVSGPHTAVVVTPSGVQAKRQFSL